MTGSRSLSKYNLKDPPLSKHFQNKIHQIKQILAHIRLGCNLTNNPWHFSWSRYCLSLHQWTFLKFCPLLFWAVVISTTWLFLKTIGVCTHLTDVSSSRQRRSLGLLTKETSNRPRALLEMFLCAARSRLPEVNFNNSSFCQVRGALMESIWCFQHCLPPHQTEWCVCQLHSVIHQKSCQVCHPLRYPLEGAASHCNRMN